MKDINVKGFIFLFTDNLFELSCEAFPSLLRTSIYVNNFLDIDRRITLKFCEVRKYFFVNNKCC